MTAQLGVQLYSLREELARDLDGVLHKLAEIGYTGVEPYRSLDAGRVAAICKQLGLTVFAAHLSIPVDDDERPTLDAAAAYGLQRVIVPWYPAETFDTADGIKALADKLNRAYDVCKAHGLALGYHNHDFEFKSIDGRPAYDLLLELINPEIFMEVDLYWVQTAGYDPVALVERLGARAPLLHFKDGPAVRGEPMTAVGDGVINLKGVNAISQAEWHIVEIDNCATDMMQAIEKSYQVMQREGFAHGKR